jgi:MFS transporter, ACS family, hexuronate transporter
MIKIPHLRWWIVAMIFFASVLNYLDRQTLSILAPTIQRDLKLSNEDYASVLNFFLIAYTTASLLSGRVVDKLGVRVSLALFVGWWSLANILTGFARSVGSLGCFRFMLGLGEAGNWTAAPKAVSEWFPARERGIAIGIYTLGATVGQRSRRLSL